MNINFKNYIDQKYGSELSSLIPQFTETIKYRKGQIITNYGEIEQFSYFIEEGIVEVEITDNTNYYLLDILFKTEMCSSYASFINNEPSDVCIKCASDCKLTKIPLFLLRESDNTLAKQVLFDEFVRYTLKRIQREKDFFLFNAKERYLKIIENNKNLIKEIPLYKLASYLKVTPERLSRIRKEIYYPEVVR